MLTYGQTVTIPKILHFSLPALLFRTTHRFFFLFLFIVRCDPFLCFWFDFYWCKTLQQWWIWGDFVYVWIFVCSDCNWISSIFACSKVLHNWINIGDTVQYSVRYFSWMYEMCDIVFDRMGISHFPKKK